MSLNPVWLNPVWLNPVWRWVGDDDEADGLVTAFILAAFCGLERIGWGVLGIDGGCVGDGDDDATAGNNAAAAAAAGDDGLGVLVDGGVCVLSLGNWGGEETVVDVSSDVSISSC